MQSGYSRKMNSHTCQLFSLICVALKWWLTPDPWPMGRPRWPFGWFVTAPHNEEEKLPGRPRNWAWELPYPTMPSLEQGCLPSRAWPKSRVMTPPVSQQGGASFHRVPASFSELSGIWAGEGQCHGVSWARSWPQIQGGQHNRRTRCSKQSAINSGCLTVWLSLPALGYRAVSMLDKSAWRTCGPAAVPQTVDPLEHL